MEIVSGGGVNGAVVHCRLLIRELVRRGHRVTLVCRPEAWIAAQLDGEPADIISSDLHRWPPDELRRIAAAARERHIDVVHTHMSRAHFFGVLLRRFSGVPCVATAHSHYFQLHWMFNDRVIAVSEATGRFHRRYNCVRPSRMDVIHNFVDYERFANVPPGTRTAIRAALGIGAACPLVGTIGDVVPRKGVVYLVESLAKIVTAIPETRLLIVGKAVDEYAVEVREAADRMGVTSNIVWAEHRDDIPAITAALDVFVSASLREDCRLSALEAMAAGLPVVTTTVGGSTECVVTGETGILVTPANVEALAEGVITLLLDETRRRRLGAAARHCVRERFSADTQVPRIEAALARAAATVSRVESASTDHDAGSNRRDEGGHA